MESIISVIVTAAAGSIFTLIVVLVVLLYLTPDRAARAGGFVAKCYQRMKPVARHLRRISARRAVQRRANGILRSGSKGRPFLAEKCRLKWENPSTGRDKFFAENRFVITLPENFDQDRTLIDVIFLFTGRSLLGKVKRLLSDEQRSAIDTYFTCRLLEARDAALRQQFVADYLPSRPTERTTQYLSAFDLLERHALFEDVFIRELSYVGEKIVALTQEPGVALEVDALLEMLMRLVERKPGEEIDLFLERNFVRCVPMLVGQPEKINQGIEPYVSFLRNCVSREIDSIYVLADFKKRAPVQKICKAVANDYTLVGFNLRRAVLFGRVTDIYLAELRARRASAIGNASIMGSGRRPFVHGCDPADVITTTDGSVLGSIKFITGNGWGYIALDDPEFLRDAWFSESSMQNRPAVVGSGDKVSCRVTRDEKGRYSASDVQVIESRLNVEDVSTTGRPAEFEVTRSAQGSDNCNTESAFRERDMRHRDQDIAAFVVAYLHESEDRGCLKVPLADVGKRIKQDIPGISPRDFGCTKMVELMENLSSKDQFNVGRFDNGHPYVALDTNDRP